MALSSFLLPILAMATQAEAEEVLLEDVSAETEWAASTSSEEKAPEASGYPATEVLDAFTIACSGVENVAVSEAVARMDGWEEFQPSPESAIGRMLSVSSSVLAKEYTDGKADSMATMRREIAGRELFLVISSVSISVKGGKLRSYGCRLYDPAALTPIGAQVLKNWAEREPDSVINGPTGASRYIWQLSNIPRQHEIEATFMPVGAKYDYPLQDASLSGIVLVASFLEAETL